MTVIFPGYPSARKCRLIGAGRIAVPPFFASLLAGRFPASPCPAGGVTSSDPFAAIRRFHRHMAGRLEQTKGDLRQQVSDRLADGFNGIRGAVEEQMTAGRREQSERLAEARTELTNSLALTTSQLKTQFDGLNQTTVQSLDSIRDRVDTKLMAITDQVQTKLDQNIKEGFAHFEKVQQHLKAAEEQFAKSEHSAIRSTTSTIS